MMLPIDLPKSCQFDRLKQNIDAPDVLNACAPNEQVLLARLSREVVLEGIPRPVGPYKGVIGIGVDEGEETGIICDFEQHRRIFARLARTRFLPRGPPSI
jgi:hypothetical protein